MAVGLRREISDIASNIRGSYNRAAVQQWYLTSNRIPARLNASWQCAITPKP